MPQDYLVNVGPFKLPRRDLDLPTLPQPSQSKILELLKGLLLGPSTEIPSEWNDMTLNERLGSPTGFRDIGGVMSILAPWTRFKPLRQLATLKTARDMRKIGIPEETISFLKSKYPRILSQISKVEAVNPDDPKVIARLYPESVYNFLGAKATGEPATPPSSIGRSMKIMISKPYLDMLKRPEVAAETLGEELAHAAQIMMPRGRAAWLYGRDMGYWEKPIEIAAKEAAERLKGKFLGMKVPPPKSNITEEVVRRTRERLSEERIKDIDALLSELQAALRRKR